MNLIKYFLDMYHSLRGQEPISGQQRRKTVPAEADSREQNTYDYDRDSKEYQRAVVAGELDALLGQYVAYHDGKIIAKAPTELGLAHKIIPLNLEGRCLIAHVGAGSIELGFPTEYSP